jgi:hypothetical protein
MLSRRGSERGRALGVLGRGRVRGLRSIGGLVQKDGERRRRCRRGWRSGAGKEVIDCDTPNTECDEYGYHDHDDAPRHLGWPRGEGGTTVHASRDWGSVPGVGGLATHRVGAKSSPLRLPFEAVPNGPPCDSVASRAGYNEASWRETGECSIAECLTTG